MPDAPSTTPTTTPSATGPATDAGQAAADVSQTVSKALPKTSGERLARALAGLRVKPTSPTSPTSVVAATPEQAAPPPAPVAELASAPPPDPSRVLTDAAPQRTAPARDWEAMFFEERGKAHPPPQQPIAPPAQETPTKDDVRSWSPRAIAEEMARSRLGEGAPDWRVKQVAEGIMDAIANEQLGSAAMLSDEERQPYRQVVEEFEEQGSRWDSTREERTQSESMRADIEQLKYAPQRPADVAAQRTVLSDALVSDRGGFRDEVPTLAALASTHDLAGDIADFVTERVDKMMPGRVDPHQWNTRAGGFAREVDAALAPMMDAIRKSPAEGRPHVIATLKIAYPHPTLHRVFDAVASENEAAAAPPPAPESAPALGLAKAAPVVQPGSATAGVQYGGLKRPRKGRTSQERLQYARRRLREK